MMKMDRLDPRILFIGAYVGCCNRIGKETEAMAIAQASSPYGGCYVLFKRNGENIDPVQDSIIAKTSVWKSKQNNIVFNSWESTEGETREEDFLKAAAKDVLEKDSKINAVKLGKNQYRYKFSPIKSDQAIDPSTASYDSEDQYLVATRKGYSEAKTIPGTQNKQESTTPSSKKKFNSFSSSS